MRHDANRRSFVFMSPTQTTCTECHSITCAMSLVNSVLEEIGSIIVACVMSPVELVLGEIGGILVACVMSLVNFVLEEIGGILLQ